MFVIYSTDRSNVYGPRGAELEGIKNYKYLTRCQVFLILRWDRASKSPCSLRSRSALLRSILSKSHVISGPSMTGRWHCTVKLKVKEVYSC